MESPAWLQECLSQFDSQATPFMEVAVGDALRAARGSQSNLDNVSWEAFLAECSAFMFYERADEDSLWGTYFAPMWESVSSDGKRTVSPDLAELTSETVRHWEERAAAVRNPILKARYADCIWDLERKITGAKRQHGYAVIAAESYIEIAKRDGFAAEVNVAAGIVRALNITGIQMLARAVQLARLVNRADIAANAASELILSCERHGDTSHAGIWLAPFDILYGQKGLLTAEQQDKIIGDLELKLQQTANVDSGKDFSPFNAQSAAERLDKHYKKLEQTQRLVQTYGLAFETMAQDASPMLAMAWMQPIIERYQQAGLKLESERLANLAAKKGERIKDDLKTYSFEVPIQRAVLDKEVDDLLAGSELSMKLYRIGYRFTPGATEARMNLEYARQNAPLMTLISQAIITEDGQTTARIGSLDEDLEGRLQKQIADHVSMTRGVLSYVLGELRKRDRPTADEIVEVLYQCPLFTERRRGLILEGISAYLADDWIKAIHVLIPQMEEVLRNLLAGVEIPTYKPNRNSPGVMDSKNMGEILGDQRIQATLGEDWWRYLSVLYVDRRGLNLRNDFAHGLLGPEVFNFSTADLVFHSFLSISMLREAK